GGYTQGIEGAQFPCGTAENSAWLSIIAASENMSISIVASDCVNGDGVELLLYDTNLEPVSTCFSSGGLNIPGNITADTLVPGEFYWIMIDGFAGDICEVTLTITGGVSTGPPDPPGSIRAIPDVSPLCSGTQVCYEIDPVQNATEYDWEWPPNATLIGSDTTNKICLLYNSNGSGIVRVTPSNPCFPGVPAVTPVVVLPIPPTILPPFFFCLDDFPVQINGNTFRQPGTYNITRQSYFGCDSIIQYIIVPLPQVPAFLELPICPGGCTTFLDSTFCTLGTRQFRIKDAAANGCDSIININIYEVGEGCYGIEGQIVDDYNGNCAKDLGEGILGGNLTLYGTDTIAVQVDSHGHYQIQNLNPGDYTLVFDDGLQDYQPCEDSIQLTLGGNQLVFEKDFYVTGPARCYDLSVFLGVNYLKRCTTNRYYVNYCNSGNATANDAHIIVELDPFMTFESASRPYDYVDGQKIKFSLGNVGPGVCGRFTVDVNLSCSNTIDGMTHCSEATIFPNIPCTPSPAWSGAVLDVFGQCLGDSVSFTIRNIGESPSRPNISYLIIEDQVVLRDTIFARTDAGLNPGETRTIEFPANGVTYRIEVPQEPFYPGKRDKLVAYVEGCKADGSGDFSTGFVATLGVGADDQTSDIECKQTGLGEYDLTKNCIPKGLGPQHFITKDLELEYKIHFQNTLNDTVDQIVIRDTISDMLDLSTLLPGASSHPYQFNRLPNRVVEFVFSNAQLPPIATNEEGSIGFVNFRIQQVPDIKQGNTIENNAFIYMGADTSYTNTFFHNVVVNEVLVFDEKMLCEGDYFAGMQVSADTFFIDTISLYFYDSIVVTTIKVGQPTLDSIDANICQGTSYLFAGEDLEAQGTYFDSLSTTFGCDSIILLNLNVQDIYLSTTALSFCEGDTVYWENMALVETGLYEVSYITQYGCDSIFQLQLDQVAVFETQIDTSICQGQAVTAGGQTFTTSGTFTIGLLSTAGCDSLITVNLQVFETSTDTLSERICERDYFYFGTDTLSGPGTYLNIEQNANGCDSTTLLFLEVDPAYEIAIDTTIKKDSSFLGVVIKTDTLLVQNLLTMEGCDSIVSYMVSVDLSANREILRDDLVRIVPNPNDGSFYLQLDLTDEWLVECRVLDIKGIEMGRKKAESMRTKEKSKIWFEEDYPPGMYYLWIQTNKGIRVRQFLVF
ncbi:MAG: hypothetical protein KDC24_08070, partial [Saprospiraceae bacterium]|nr:hypothetical protein [Saprospiraceae bacterium]